MARRSARPTGQFVFAGAVLALLAVWGALEVLEPTSFIGPSGSVIAYVEELDDGSPAFRAAAYVHHGKPREEATPEESASLVESLVAIATTDARDTLLGRPVHLRNLHVMEVTSDRSFFVRPADGTMQRQFLVVRDDESDRAVEHGALIGLEGMICGVPDDVPAAWALDPEELTLVAEERVYLLARRLTFESPP